MILPFKVMVIWSHHTLHLLKYTFMMQMVLNSLPSTFQAMQVIIPVLNVGPSNEIVVSNGRKEIYIYDPSGKVLKHTVPTAKNVSRQAFVTRSGVIVSSSCYLGSTERVDGL